MAEPLKLAPQEVVDKYFQTRGPSRVGEILTRQVPYSSSWMPEAHMQSDMHMLALDLRRVYSGEGIGPTNFFALLQNKTKPVWLFAQLRVTEVVGGLCAQAMPGYELSRLVFASEAIDGYGEYRRHNPAPSLRLLTSSNFALSTEPDRGYTIPNVLVVNKDGRVNLFDCYGTVFRVEDEAIQARLAGLRRLLASGEAREVLEGGVKGFLGQEDAKISPDAAMNLVIVRSDSQYHLDRMKRAGYHVFPPANIAQLHNMTVETVRVLAGMKEPIIPNL